MLLDQARPWRVGRVLERHALGELAHVNGGSTAADLFFLVAFPCVRPTVPQGAAGDGV